MKEIGWVLLIVGGYVGLFLTRGYDIGGMFLAVIGLMLVIIGSKNKQSKGTVKCPYCAELISNEAMKCKHCKSDVQPTSLKTEEKPTDESCWK